MSGYSKVVIMDMKVFEALLKSAFPRYDFKLSKQGAGWCRIFINYHGISIGRLNFEPVSVTHKTYKLYGYKAYKPYYVPFSQEDKMFYQIGFWVEYGRVVEIDDLVEVALRMDQERFDKQMEWRKANPKVKGRRKALTRIHGAILHNLILDRFRLEEIKEEEKV